MNKICISCHLECMDHEFDHLPLLRIEAKGYKVDDKNGIVKKCRLNGFQAVDYLAINSTGEFLFIEFTDIATQFSRYLNVRKRIIDLADGDECLTSVESDGVLEQELKDINLVLKKIEDIVPIELAGKAKDTLRLLDKLDGFYINIPSQFNKSPVFVIVVSSDEPKDRKCFDSIQVPRFVNQLILKVKGRLPDEFDRVKMEFVTNFAREFRN